jgi:hypothetical protein
MTNKICEKCKPDKPEAHSSLLLETGCNIPYSFVELCKKSTTITIFPFLFILTMSSFVYNIKSIGMLKNNGNVSSCKEEWKSFRLCFNKIKKDNEDKLK